MSLTEQTRSEERPSTWAVGFLAISVLALVAVFALLALVP